MSIARLMQMGAAGAPKGPVWTDPDLANASYDSVSFNVGTQESSLQALSFKPDGTKMYVTGRISDAVNEYNLSTAWDASTASYLQNFIFSAQEANPRGLFFKPDGAKLYVIGTDGDDVNEYNLSTPWDVSTASYLQNFSVSAQEGSPLGLFFSPTGTKMYVTGSIGIGVNEYNLSTAWDVSTASYLQFFSVFGQGNGPTGVFFKSDGAKMYVAISSNSTIFQYSTA